VPDPGPDGPIRLIDARGAWLAPDGPPHSDDLLRELLVQMLAIRQMDERFQNLVRTGRVSIMTSAAGHEAAHVGMARALERGRDWLFPYYRDQGLLLAYGVPAREIFGQMLATRADPGLGRQTPTHIVAKHLRVFSMTSPVGSHLPAAAGAAIGLARREPGAAVLASFGDGATATGDFHGALTLAGVERAPVVFVCENNQYAISVPLSRQSASVSIAAKAAAYGMPGVVADGFDVLAVERAVGEALARARAAQGPSLVELDLYRYAPHSSSDDDMRYRTSEAVAARRAEDPVDRFRRYLEGRALWDEARERAALASTGAALDAAIAEADAAGPVAPEAMFDDVFAEPPWHLVEQRRRLSYDLD